MMYVRKRGVGPVGPASAHPGLRTEYSERPRGSQGGRIRMIAGQRGEEFEEVALVHLDALYRGARRLTRPRAETTQADGFFERYEVERVGRGGHVRPHGLRFKSYPPRPTPS